MLKLAVSNLNQYCANNVFGHLVKQRDAKAPPLRCKKKQTSFLFAFLLLIAIGSPVAASAKNSPPNELGAVTIEISDYTLDEGAAFEIPIELVTSETPIGALTFSVFYDPSVISISTCSLNTAFSAICNTNLDAKVIMTGISAEGVSEDLTFATLLGTVIGTAGQSTDLRIEVSQVADQSGSPINDLTAISGSLSVPEPLSENNPPTISNPGNQSGVVGDNVNLTILATDPDVDVDEGDSLSFEAAGLPMGLAISSGSGQITGTLAISETNLVSVTVSDSRGGTATTSFNWIVVDPAAIPTNRPPSITAPVTQASVVGDQIDLSISATDPDSGDILEFSAEGLPQGLAIDPSSGQITGTVAVSGTTVVTITVSDGQSVDSSTFTWIVTDPPPEISNTPPSINAPTTLVHFVGDLIDLTLSAVDPDLGDILEFSVEGLPQGLTLNTASGAITGTVTISETNVVTATVSDGQSEDSAAFTWIVSDPPTEDPPAEDPPTEDPPTEDPLANSDPVIESPGDLNSVVGDSISLTLNGTDPDSDDVLSYGAGGLPIGLTFRPDIGLISGVVTQAGTYMVTAVVRDGKGGSDSVLFVWTVAAVQSGPVVSTPEAQSIVAGQQVSLAILATDPSGGALQYTSENLPPGLVLDANTGMIEGSVDSPGDYEVTIEVTNEEGETSTVTFGWRVEAADPANPPGGVNSPVAGDLFLPLTP